MASHALSDISAGGTGIAWWVAGACPCSSCLFLRERIAEEMSFWQHATPPVLAEERAQTFSTVLCYENRRESHWRPA